MIAPDGFATISKNADNSFTIDMFSDNPALSGSGFNFYMAFTDSMGTPVNGTGSPQFFIVVSTCATSIDCSNSRVNNQGYFIGETK